MSLNAVAERAGREAWKKGGSCAPLAHGVAVEQWDAFRFGWLSERDRTAQIAKTKPTAPIPPIAAVFAAAKELNADAAFMSWNGFNIAGDRASIDEVSRLMQEAGRAEALCRELVRLRAAVAK